MAAPRTSTRHTADERRDQILEAAVAEFAATGLHGTSTDTIARRVGISQPYLFRLFGTKKDLFIAAVERNFDQTIESFERAAADAPAGQVLPTMGKAYSEMLADRERLLNQMQAYAACDDPEVRAVVRRRFSELYRLVERLSGASADQVRAFVATGMLLNVAAAMDLPAIAPDEGWVRRFLDTEE